MSGQRKIPKTAIAVIGMAGRFPNARTVDEFWANLRAGLESLERFSDADLQAVGVDPRMLADPRYVKAGTALERAAEFDAAFFGINPREAEVMDPQHRIFLECAWEAMEDAGYDVERIDVPVGVFAGASMNSWVLSNLLANPEAVAAVGGYQAMIGNDKDFLATRVSYKLNLRGPSLAVKTACSTSLVAVHMACESLLTHQCDMALAGGVSLVFPQRTGYLYQEGMITSPDAKVRPFDARGKGIRPGEGVGLVLLKRLEDAVADGDAIRAVILGTAINNDGAHKIGYTAPSVDGQAEAIASAQSVAEVNPDTITYIEAHGTSTPLGDPIEIAALTKVFQAQTSERQFCAIGSVKSNIGHLDAAAGIAGLIKTVLALEHRELPPSLNFETPNPQIDFANSPFFVNAQLRPWNPPGVRRAGVSSFGIGGTNAHAVLEEWTPLPRAPTTGPPSSERPTEQAIVLSARTADALDSMRARLAAFLERRPETDLEDLAFTLQSGRRVFEHRAVFFARDQAAARQVLRENRVAARAQGPLEQRSATFMFSGQGSQYAAMGAALYASERIFRASFDQCAEILEPHLQLDLRALVFPDFARSRGLPAPDGEALNDTRLTQPALFAIEYALAKLWAHWGIVPQAMIGHSIGEYVAACLAGVFTLEPALEVVAARGALMQRAEPGAMLAVQLDEAQLSPHLRNGLAIAALNAPGACVVSGPTAAVDALEARLEAAGAACRRLRTSHAFHSPMMQPVVEAFVAAVAQQRLQAPAIPFVSNVTGTWITPQQATDPAYWGQHLRGAVRFADGVRTLAKDTSRLFIEVGPGDTLRRLSLLSLDGVSEDGVLSSLPHPLDKLPADVFMRRALARVWLAGMPVNWSAQHETRTPRRVALPTYPFESRRYWIEAAPAAAAAARAAKAPTAPPATQSAGAAAMRRPMQEWYWLPSWRRGARLPRSAVPGSLGQRWLVFADGSPPASELIAALRAEGVTVDVVRAGDVYRDDGVRGEIVIRPEAPEDYVRLFAGGARYHCVTHAWNVSDAAGPPDPVRGRREAFYSPLYLAQALSDLGLREPLPMLFLSTGLQRVLGHEPLRTERALILGPVLLMPQDVPALRARSIDLAVSDWNAANAGQLARALLSEVATPSQPNVLAYRSGYRWEQTTSAVGLPEPPEAAPLRERGVYLITGGTGGLGLAIARDLAARYRARLVLSSRSGAASSAGWDRTQRELEALGAEVLVVAADCADRARMKDAIATARERFGPINGVIHAAGLPGRGMLQMKTRDQTEAVLRPKVEGTLILDELLAGEQLDFLALFSTINTAFAWQGATDYSSANAFLDAFAQAGESRSTSKIVAINWGPWREVGMAAAFATEIGRADAMDVAISPTEGAQAFARVLANDVAQIFVSPFAMPELIAASATARDQASHIAAAASSEQSAKARATSMPTTPAGPSAPANAQHQRPQLDTPFVAPRDAHEQKLASIWADLLGIAPIGADDDFFELGGHSLLATRILSRVQDAFQIALPMRAIFEAPTIGELAARVRAAAGAQAPGASQPDEEREEIEL